MTEEEKRKREKGEISRREFLKDAGFVIGGAAIGAGITYPLVPKEEVEKTITTTTTKTVEVPGPTKTVTVEVPGEVEPGLITLTVNGKTHVLKVEPYWPLGFVLREKLLLTGTKLGCERGECGTCTILVDGDAVLACMMLAVEAEGHNIVTIEGLADGPNLHPVQQLFLDNMTYQCGFCTPGNIMSAVALLEKHPSPTRAQVKEAISGNLCMCGDYTRTINTILKGGS